MLGHYPEYKTMAKREGFRYFEVPKKHWDRLGEIGPGEQWAANKRFLDRGIARGEEHVLSGPVREGPSQLRLELEYLAGRDIHPPVFKLRQGGGFP